MSTIDYDPLDEEEAFTEAALNAGFDELATGINAIDMDAAKRYALRSEHQPSLTPAVEHPAVTWTKEMEGTIDVGSDLFRTYDTPVRGPDGDLEVLFPSGITLGMSEASGATDRVGALLVLANVRIGKMTVSGIPATHNNLVILTIQVQGILGWVDVPRTRRSLSMPDYTHLIYTPKNASLDQTNAAGDFEDYVDYDIPLRTLIDVEDLPASATGVDTIYGVRVVIRGADAPTGMPSGGGWAAKLDTGADAAYSVAQSNLSVIPFHALSVMN